MKRRTPLPRSRGVYHDAMNTQPSSGIVVGLIGGSGLGQALGAETGKVHEIETPFGPPSCPITEVQWHGQRVLILQRHGIGHTLNPSQVPYRANLFALKSLGVTHILASGATGSLREGIHPGELVLVDQFIDKTTQRTSTFFDHAAVHVELADPCCPVMRGWLEQAAKGLTDADGQPVTTHQTGTYVCMEGPSFSTKAESEMHRAWGGDLIGMTAMPEAKLAREAELAYALIAMPTDYDCWKPHPDGIETQALLQEIIGNLQRASNAALLLIKKALEDISPLAEQPSPAHSALALGIWSDKKALDPEAIERLRPLWGKYFQ